MRPTIIINSLAGIVLIFACGKPVKKAHPDMVGYWRTSNTTLEIKSSGDAYWGRLTNTEEESIHGKARIKNNKLIISGGGIKKEVNINWYPHEEQANFTEYNTVMILNDEKFYKTPKISIDKDWRCGNGIRDGDETAVDCGGDCEPCPTCNDHVKNQDETGLDCGGICGPCETAYCANDLAANTGTMATCPGNTVIGLQQNFSNPEFVFTDSLNRYSIQNSYGQWDLIVVLPQKPVATLKYHLTSEFYDVDETSDYNLASIQLKHNFGSEPARAYPVSGELYVTVINGDLTFIFCHILFNSTQYGCIQASGKLVR
jgi:hypothetical protein